MKILILMSLLFTSCATKQLVLTTSELLPYKESAQVTKINFQTKSVNILKIVDKREETTYGFAYTGVQYQKTPLIFNENLNILLMDYFSTALDVRNISVALDGRPLEIEVEKLWVEEVIENFQPEKAKCVVRLNFHMNLPEEKWSGKYWAEYISEGDLVDGTERLAPTLASCLNEIVEKLVNDQKFINLLK